MRDRRPAILLTMAMTALGSVQSRAQTAPETAPQPADPPARVGRIAALRGTVSFHSQSADRWEVAIRNYPLTQGDALWTEPRGSTTIDLGGARIVLRDATEISLDNIEPNEVTATSAQGELCLTVEPTPDLQSYTVHTPRGAVTVKQPGRYGILAGDTETPTRVTVLAGAAEIVSGTSTLQIAAGQAGVATGMDNVESRVVPASPDPFLASVCVPPRPAAPAASPSAGAPPVTAMMVGAADLDDYGSWQAAPEYGAVWYPRVAPDWVPYRQGHWAFVQPWSWTWIDDAAWGFAPFHYGRWAQFGGRWGWIPAGETGERAQRPVYAPALVSFIAPGFIAPGFSAPGAALGAIAWLPLGPREPFHPWYHASDVYVRNVNIRQVQSITNVTEINRVTTINTYINRGATTAVPAAIVTQSRPVATVGRPLPAQAMATARPLIGDEPTHPTARTQGITPALASRLQLPPQRVPSIGQPAPGPALHAAGPPSGQEGRPNPPAPAQIPLATPGASHARPGEAVAPRVGERAGGQPQGGPPAPDTIARPSLPARAPVAATPSRATAPPSPQVELRHGPAPQPQAAPTPQARQPSIPHPASERLRQGVEHRPLPSAPMRAASPPPRSAPRPDRAVPPPQRAAPPHHDAPSRSPAPHREERRPEHR